MSKETSNRKKLSELLDTSEKKSYFVIAITAFFTILVLGFGVLPSFSAVTLQTSQNSRRAYVIEQIERKKTDISLLNREIQQSQNLIERLTDALPAELMQDRIFEQITQLADRNSMRFQSINFVQSLTPDQLFSRFQVDDRVRAVSLNLVLQSSDTSFVNFLRDIENLKQVFTVNSVVVARVLDAQIGSFYQINLLMDYFYYLD